MPSIDDLAEELLDFILCKVSPYEDLKACSLVCWRWNYCCQRVARKKTQMFRTAIVNGPLSYSSFSADDYVGSPAITLCITTRYSHSACIFGSNMYVFGGCTSISTTFNDLWKVDLRTKKRSRVLTTGNYPAPKAHASMVVWNESLVLFGGWTHPSVFPMQHGILFDELHIYNTSLNTWTQLYYPNAPPATAGHSSTVHCDVVLIVGGLQKNGATNSSTNDVYCLDLVNMTWFRPRVSEPAPSPRYGHSQIKVDERHVIIMAGCGGYNDLHNDFWLLTIPPNIRSNEVWTWKLLTIAGASEHIPKQLWCNPTCKVDDHVIVLAQKNEPENQGAISSAQFPIRLRRVPSNYHVTNSPRSAAANRAQPSDDRIHAAASSHSHNNIPAVAAAAGTPEPGSSYSRPSVRPNASSNRERRLSMLSMYEDRLRASARAAATAASPPVAARPTRPKPACCQVVYLLDISKVLTSFILTWQPGPGWENDEAPHPRLLCSMLLGRGELILCCGRDNWECTCKPVKTLPQLLYISAPNIPLP